MNEQHPTLGQRIKARRNELGLSLAHVGRACGVSYQAVQQWENDETLPDTPHLIGLDLALQLERGDLGEWIYDAPRLVATLLTASPENEAGFDVPGWECLRQITAHIAATSRTLVPAPTPVLKVA